MASLMRVISHPVRGKADFGRYVLLSNADSPRKAWRQADRMRATHWTDVGRRLSTQAGYRRFRRCPRKSDDMASHSALRIAQAKTQNMNTNVQRRPSKEWPSRLVPPQPAASLESIVARRNSMAFPHAVV